MSWSTPHAGRNTQGPGFSQEQRETAAGDKEGQSLASMLADSVAENWKMSPLGDAGWVGRNGSGGSVFDTRTILDMHGQRILGRSWGASSLSFTLRNWAQSRH